MDRGDSSKITVLLSRERELEEVLHVLSAIKSKVNNFSNTLKISIDLLMDKTGKQTDT